MGEQKTMENVLQGQLCVDPKKISPFILFNFNGNLFGGKWVIR